MTAFYTELLQQTMQQRQQAGLHRQRRLISQPKQVIQFSHNDYLSLASDERILHAYQDAFSQEASGSGGSMLVSGYHAAHRDLERAFAEALQVDDCVLFSSGYAANLCIASVLKSLQPIVFVDKSIHASVYDGLQLAQLPMVRFLHNDLDDLSRKLSLHATKAQKSASPFHPIIMTESIFSMSGQCAPLQQLNQLAKVHQATLLIDEAHAFGVVGQEGLGAVSDAGLTQDQVPLRMIPFGKALGASGAIVAGNKIWIDALLQTRPAVYSTAISPAYARGVMAALAVIRASDDRRQQLKQLIAYFREAIKQSPLTWRDSQTQIQQLQLGCPHRANKLTESLLKQGIVCLAMRQPTVTREETGLRVILNYHHQPEHIDLLFQAVHQS